jgi:hypothetical protein
MRSAPDTVAVTGVASRRNVAKVESVENSALTVVERFSGLIVTLTDALELVIASSDLNSTLGAAYAGQVSVGET